MPLPAHILGSGLVSALGRDRQEVVAQLYCGQAQPEHLVLPDLGLGTEFLFRAIPPVFAPVGQNRLTAMIEGAVEDALCSARLSSAQRRRLPVFVGSSSRDLARIEAIVLRGSPPSSQQVRQLGWNVIAEEIAQRFQLGGPQFSFSSACSSSSNALLAALEQIGTGCFDAALVVGIECGNQLGLHGFNSLRLLAEDACRPFDLHRQGMVLGEGAGAVVIGRGNGSCRLLGGASLIDKSNITKPSIEGMVAAMAAALEAAAVAAPAVTAVKTHGAGAEASDATEGLALQRLFANQPPPVTSLKPQLGYTLGANGILELIAMHWCLAAGFLPATPNFSLPDPAIGISPQTSPLPVRNSTILMNCFGFGGNNSCLVIAHD